jgi:glycosidase
MQWDGSPHGGFSTAEPWLPVHPNHTLVNVEEERGDPGSLLSFYRELIWLRKRTPALNQGTARSLVSGPTDCLAFLRCHEDQTVLVLLNFVAMKVGLRLPGEEGGVSTGTWEVLFGTQRAKGSRTDVSADVDLKGYEVLILERKEGLS